MTTNEAFIKAYRRDAAYTATPAPTRSRQAAEPIAPSTFAAAWQTTVEIAAANYTPTTTTIATAIGIPEARPLRRSSAPVETESPRKSSPIIGKRPLSSFQLPPQRPNVAPQASSVFTPETILSAFRWPAICRSLWDLYASEYERVADNLLAASRMGRPMIGVTGINAGDGATTTLLCLAAALAARSTRLALVDANFLDPQLAGRLGAQPTASWADVLERGTPVAEAMIRATKDRLDLLPLRADGRLAGHEAAHLVAGLQTSVTAGVLRTAYDMVLVDLGALLAPGAYASMSSLLRLMPIDAAVVITNPRTANADDAAIVGELLEEDGCELIGVIENRAKPPAAV